MIPFQKQTIKIGQPSLQLHKAATILPALDLTDKRRPFLAACIDIDIGAITTIPTGATQRHPLGMNANIFVERNDLSFNATPLALTASAHDLTLARPIPSTQ
jgi:hypothetical protein